mgnify:CR=1 FL=1
MMSTVNGTKNGVMEGSAAMLNLQQLDAKIADARRAQSESIKRMIVGSLAAIDRRLLHRSAVQD